MKLFTKKQIISLIIVLIVLFNYLSISAVSVVYALSDGYSLTISEDKIDLGTTKPGYDRSDHVAHLTVTNNGTNGIYYQYTKLELSGDNPDSFIAGLNNNGYFSAGATNTTTYYVSPKDRLVPGKYNAIVSLAISEDGENFEVVDKVSICFTVSEHNFSSGWSTNTQYHWHECLDDDCGEKGNFGPHDKNITKNAIEPTFYEDGYTGDKYCSVCDYKVEDGKLIAAGMFIRESRVIMTPSKLIEGKTPKDYTFTPAEPDKYVVGIGTWWDLTSGDQITSTTPLIKDHEYRIPMEFDSAGTYAYNETDSEYGSEFYVNNEEIGTTMSLSYSTYRIYDTVCIGTDTPVTNYNLWVGGIQVSSINSSGEGWSYDANNNVLTLDNYNYSSAAVQVNGIYAGIYSESDLTINLVGTSTIRETSSDVSNSYGINVNSKLTFKGDGTLTASGTITGTTSGYSNCGIAADEILLDSDFTGILNAIGGKSNASNAMATMGVYTKTLTVNNGILNTLGGTASDSYASSTGIFMGAPAIININGGTVFATGGIGGSTGYSNGIWMYGEYGGATGTINVGPNAILNAVGGNAKASYGIVFENSSGGLVNVSPRGSLVAYSNGSGVGNSMHSGASCGIRVDNSPINARGNFIAYTRGTSERSGDTVCAVWGGTGAFNIYEGKGYSNIDGTEGETILSTNGTTADLSSYKYVTTKTAPVYTVTFDLDGGTMSSPLTQAVEYGELATRPDPDPTKTKSNFIGWYVKVDDDIYISYEFDTPVTEDLIIYAGWEPLFTVTYDFNGGTRNGESSYVVESVGYGMILTEENLISLLGVTPPDGRTLKEVLVNDVKFDLGSPYELNKDTTIKYIWSEIEGEKLKFEDIPEGSWYYDSVKYVSERGIITGYNEKTFGPFNNLTREQLVNILWRIEGKPDAGELENKFSDVPDGTWYTDAIKWASENGIVRGHGGTTLFGVGENIIRQDLAIMLSNYAKYKGIYVEPTVTLDNFADKETVSSYAVEAVSWASENGIISGNNNSDGTRTIAPLNNAMRCEAAVMLMRFCENIL